MSEEIVAGDVVQLKSGGEAMTVEAITEVGIACAWFVGKKLERATFQPEALTKTQPRKPGIGSVGIRRR